MKENLSVRINLIVYIYIPIVMILTPWLDFSWSWEIASGCQWSNETTGDGNAQKSWEPYRKLFGKIL